VRTIASDMSDILTWSGFSQPHGYNFNGFLISGTAGLFKVHLLGIRLRRLGNIGLRCCQRASAPKITTESHAR
jgi:hypothetical protein